MTKITLTDDLKKIALQQYHPYIDIDLWSLTQDEFENETYIFQDTYFNLPKYEILNLFNEETSVAAVRIMISDDFIIDKTKIYPFTSQFTINTNEFSSGIYVMSLNNQNKNITIDYYYENTIVDQEFITLNVTAYDKQHISQENIKNLYDATIGGYDFNELTEITFNCDSDLIFIGTTNDAGILNDDSFIQIPIDIMPDTLKCKFNTAGTKNISLDFYTKNSSHSNLERIDDARSTLSLCVLSDKNDTSIKIVQNDTVNVKILNKDIESLLYEADKKEYQKYVSKPEDTGYNQGNFDNIIFTPQNDLDTIIPYEYYKGVFYLQMPQFYKTISMHILTKYFGCADNVILLNTEDIIDIIEGDDSESIWNSSDNTSRTINKINMMCSRTNSEYGRYLIPFPSDIQKLSSLEIDIFSQYTNGTSQIGVIDINDRGYPDTDTAEKYQEQHTLLCNKHQYTNSSIQTITATRIADDILKDQSYSYSDATQSHNTILLNQNKNTGIKESIIRYINDNIYIEEYNTRDDSDNVDRVSELTTNNKYNYTNEEWQNNNE